MRHGEHTQEEPDRLQLRVPARCKYCDREAPTSVLEAFQRQLIAVSGPGIHIEGTEPGGPPRIWLMRTGGPGWGEHVFSCPDHRVQFLAT
jgi:hypothetical protein